VRARWSLAPSGVVYCAVSGGWHSPFHNDPSFRTRTRVFSRIHSLNNNATAAAAAAQSSTCEGGAMIGGGDDDHRGTLALFNVQYFNTRRWWWCRWLANGRATADHYKNVNGYRRPTATDVILPIIA